MKTMPCKELGGPCEEQLSAESWDDMVATMTKHLVKFHPKTTVEMEQMHKDDPEKWAKEMKPKWEAALDS